MALIRSLCRLRPFIWGNSDLFGSDGKASATMREPGVQSLGQEDPLEKEIATHSSTVAWKFPWTEESGGLQSIESQRIRRNWVTNTFTFTLFYLVLGSNKFPTPLYTCVITYPMFPSPLYIYIYMSLPLQFRYCNILQSTYHISKNHPVI